MSGYHRDRDPLTLRMARTAAETARDPSLWWEGPAERSFVVAMAPRPRRIRTRRSLVRRLIDWFLGERP